MTEPDGIRISDADRERYAQRLRTAYAEGRITDAELEERLRAVYQARFGGEIEAITADLPAPSRASVSPLTGGRGSIDAANVIRTAAQWYFPALVCTGIWAITSFGGYFWPIWVFFGLTIPFVSSLIFDKDPANESDLDTNGSA